jgi:hypothetical protein
MSLDTRGVQIPNGSKNPDDEHLCNGNKKPRAIHGGCLGDLRLYPVVPASDLTDRIPLKSISVTGRKFFLG